LSEKGYSLIVENEEGVEEEQNFFSKKILNGSFSRKNKSYFLQNIFGNALKDPISGETGKSIVFCVSQNHASKITQILNQFADQLWPGKYNSDFAVQVTSNIPDAQQFTINYSNNYLNGQTKWLVGYKSSKTRVCVTVGMMTTGYDCPDILNLCLMRPIFSPTDFIQIKGRGTRKYTFSYKDADNEQIKAEKETFKLFDFFANCEYFEEKYNYDQVLKLPIKTRSGTGGGEGVDIDEVSIFNPDPLKTFRKSRWPCRYESWLEIFWKFEHVVKNDPVVKQKYEQGDVVGAEEYVKTKIFDKPEDYFNLDKLRKAVKADRRITLKEFIEKIFGGINKFKTKDELLEEEFEKFVSIYKPESKYVPYIKNYLKAYITDPEIRDIVETKEYSRFATNPKVTMKDFRDLNGWRDVVPEYVKDYVSINTFM